MNIFKKISLANKIAKIYEEVTDFIECHNEVTEEIKEIINDAKALCEKIIKAFPELKGVVKDIKELLERI